MNPYKDAQYYMAEIAFDTCSSYEVVECLCQCFIEELGWDYDKTFETVRRILE